MEVKLGGESLIKEGIANLNSLASKIDNERMDAPAFRMVLTGMGEYAYATETGVVVVPISALRP